VPWQPGQEPGHGGQGRTIVAAIGGPAHEQAYGPGRTHGQASILTSRKCVAHEIHGS
jgi:hypothetical protein